jgi:hypothetical protein
MSDGGAFTPDAFDSLESGRSANALGKPQPLPPGPGIGERLGEAVVQVTTGPFGSVFNEFMVDEFMNADEDGGGGQSTTMRHRHTTTSSSSSAAAAAAAAPTTTAPVLSKATRHATATATLVSTNIDVVSERLMSRCGPRLERCYQQRNRVRNTLCGCIIVGTAIACVIGLLSDQTAYVEDAMRPTYARSGVDGVRFDRPVEDLTCGEIESAMVQRVRRRGEPTLFDDVRHSMRTLLDQDELSCICAPMVGSHRNFALVRSGQVVIDLYNVYHDQEWDGRIDDVTSLDVRERVRVSESQEHLFPGRSEPVKKVRLQNVRLVYLDNECTTQSIVLRKSHARCMQVCVDLMQGRSIYDD